MSAPSPPKPAGSDAPVDEFDWIAQRLRPLTRGAPEAFGLLDDAAAIPSRPGFDLIISKDALVEGVHFLSDDPPGAVARKLLRTNLSDLAAKGAEPYGYFLAVAWPASYGQTKRDAFVAGLDADQTAFGLVLLGGDTVSTPGPLTLSATILGWAPAGTMMRRNGAGPGDIVLVSGSIGDGWLGLRAARGEPLGLTGEDTAWLAGRYHIPEPRLGLGEALRLHAHACADVSDGLIADIGHIAAASGCAIAIDLDRTPLSGAARRWLAAQPDPASARLALAVGGDDYEIICTASAAHVGALIDAAGALGVVLTPIGHAGVGEGVRATCSGQEIFLDVGGFRHT